MHTACTLRQSAHIHRAFALILYSMRTPIGCHTAEQWTPGAKSGPFIGSRGCPMVG